MASTDSPAVKRPGKAKSKRFIQPVIPALPQIASTRKNHETLVNQIQLAANESTKKPPGGESSLASSNTTLNLPNGVHKDEIQETSEKGAPVEPKASSAAPSPTQNASTAYDPSSEPPIAPSALPERSTLAPNPPCPPEASTLQPYQPYQTSSTIPNTNGFNFASNLSQARLHRAREHNIMFHAPLESPSPSRTTQRSLSSLSISTPPPDLSELRVASTAPELGTPLSQGRQTTATTELQLPQAQSAELPEQYPAPPPSDWSWLQSVTQPESVLERVEPGPSSIKVRDLHQSYDVFQPAVEDSDMAKLNGESDDRQSLEIQNLNLETDAAEKQVETQNGFDEQQSHRVQGYEDGNRPNGHEQSNRNSVHSTPSGYWPLPSDPEEQAVPTVLEQLARLFVSREFADWSIDVSGPYPHLRPFGYFAHGIIMARSPTLRQEMRRQMHSHRIERMIVISPDWYIQPQGFEAVLRYLYTESLLTRPEVEQMSCIGSLGNGTSTRDYQHYVLLSYWMAGLILRLPPVADRAVQLVQETMHWDILEVAFQQALILEERALKPTTDLSTTQPNTPGSSRAGTVSVPSSQNVPRTPFSPSSADFVPTAYLNATQDHRYPTINAMMSKEIKRIVYEFISQYVDKSNFETDDPPNPAILKSYLPETHEYSNSSRYPFNPALAAIRFGDLPLAEETKASETAKSAIPRSTGQIASAVLLNLKYADLCEFCTVLKNRALKQPTEGSACDWIKKIVAEREKRRCMVLNSKTVSNHERLAHGQAWNVVGYEEYVEATDKSVGEWELCRKCVGFNLPVRQ